MRAANQLSILVGRYDLNTEFDRLQSAGLFLNSSFGMGPEFSQSGRSGPSIFPDTSLGARMAWKPARGVVLRAALLDGVPVERPGGREAFAHGDGLLTVTEAAVLFRPASGESPRNPRFRLGRLAGLPPYATKIAVGAWYYTAKYPDLSETDAAGQPVEHRGSSGFYALADQTIYTDRQLPARRVMLFAQFGAGDGRVNHFGRYTGIGTVMSAPIASRVNDEVGVSLAVAHNSAHFAALQNATGSRAANAEATLECTYLAVLTSRLAIQPDLQYVMHPNSDRGNRNALVALLRFELSF